MVTVGQSSINGIIEKRREHVGTRRNTSLAGSTSQHEMVVKHQHHHPTGINRVVINGRISKIVCYPAVSRSEKEIEGKAKFTATATTEGTANIRVLPAMCQSVLY